MARIVRFHETGGPEVLRLDQVPERDPGPGEVRLKIEAIGLNRAEVMLREGVYHEQPIFPSRIGYEAAGVVTNLAGGWIGARSGLRTTLVAGLGIQFLVLKTFPNLYTGMYPSNSTANSD